MNTREEHGRPEPADRPGNTVTEPHRETDDARHGTDPRPEIVPRVPRVAHDEGVTHRRDRIRWGSVWAGLAVTVSIYLVMQLALVATGVIDLGAADRNDAWFSAGVALLAFFIGGATTGASAIWNELDDGVLHGIVMWAVGVVALLVLSVVGGNLALGALDASGAFESVRVDLDAGEIEGVETALGAEDAEEAASWVLLALGAALLASIIGAAAGAKLWPRTDEVRIDEVDASTST